MHGSPRVNQRSNCLLTILIWLPNLAECQTYGYCIVWIKGHTEINQGQERSNCLESSMTTKFSNKNPCWGQRSCRGLKGSTRWQLFVNKCLRPPDEHSQCHIRAYMYAATGALPSLYKSLEFYRKIWYHQIQRIFFPSVYLRTAM